MLNLIPGCVGKLNKLEAGSIIRGVYPGNSSSGFDAGLVFSDLDTDIRHLAIGQTPNGLHRQSALTDVDNYAAVIFCQLYPGKRNTPAGIEAPLIRTSIPRSVLGIGHRLSISRRRAGATNSSNHSLGPRELQGVGRERWRGGTPNLSAGAEAYGFVVCRHVAHLANTPRGI